MKPLHLTILLGYTLALTGCATKQPPSAVIGVDIAQVKKGDTVLFDGMIFSPFYLENYLQWKDQK